MTQFKPTVDQLVASIKRCVHANDQVGAQRAVEELITRAWQSMENDDTGAEAAAIGRKLQEVGHPAGYEIVALVEDHNGDLDKALATLEKGVEALPDIWRLWELLGSLYADSAKHDQAQEAFERALSCPQVDAATVRLSQALAQCQAEKYDQALATLNKVDIKALDDVEERLHATAMKASVLCSLERWDDTIKLASAELKPLDLDQLPDEAMPHLSELKAQYAAALFKTKHEAKAAWAQAREALACDAENELALSLMREIRNEKSPKAQIFEISVGGSIPSEEGEGEDEFVQDFVVVADDKDDAMKWIREVAFEEVRDAMHIVECETVKPAPEEPKGVVEMSSIEFLVDDDEEEDEPEGA